jgi:hypothetical protein
MYVVSSVLHYLHLTASFQCMHQSSFHMVFVANPSRATANSIPLSKVRLTTKIAPSQHTSEGLDAQEVSQDQQHNKRRSVTDLTNLEINRANVELVLGRNGSQTTPGRIQWGETRGGSPRTSKDA